VAAYTKKGFSVSTLTGKFRKNYNLPFKVERKQQKTSARNALVFVTPFFSRTFASNF
jgi:hypothetical protein